LVVAGIDGRESAVRHREPGRTQPMWWRVGPQQAAGKVSLPVPNLRILHRQLAAPLDCKRYAGWWAGPPDAGSIARAAPRREGPKVAHRNPARGPRSRKPSCR